MKDKRNMFCVTVKDKRSMFCVTVEDKRNMFSLFCVTVKDKRNMFGKKKKPEARSMDDSSVEGPVSARGTRSMKRQTSETDLAADFLAVPSDKSKSASKLSLIERFGNSYARRRRRPAVVAA